MDHRSAQLKRKVERKEVASVAKCSPQNIGMIINNSKGVDQRLSPVGHAAVARLLNVNPDWLLTGEGLIESTTHEYPSNMSKGAKDIGALFDMIPEANLIDRMTAFNAATTEIMRVLRDVKPTR